MSDGIVKRLIAVYAAPKHAGSNRDLNERFAREELAGLSSSETGVASHAF